MTMEMAKTLVEVFQRLYEITLDIKFPNDIVYRNKKLGGILTQTKSKGDLVTDLVVGIRNQYQSRKMARRDKKNCHFCKKRVWN